MTKRDRKLLKLIVEFGGDCCALETAVLNCDCCPIREICGDNDDHCHTLEKALNMLEEVRNPIEEQIGYIMKHMNFEQIRRMMEASDWRWAQTEGLLVPTVSQLEETALMLLYSAYEESSKEGEKWSVSTGGFTATCEVEEGNDCVLSLNFGITIAGGEL